jgi:hypothetical protein
MARGDDVQTQAAPTTWKRILGVMRWIATALGILTALLIIVAGGFAIWFSAIGSPLSEANSKAILLELGQKRIEETTIPAVEARIGRVTDRIATLTDRIASLEASRLGIEGWRYLFTEDNGFSVLDVSTGKFLVSRVKQESVGDGYRVTFQIGNIQAANYFNAKLEVSWGERYDVAKHGTYRQWEEGRASVATTADRLAPTAWTNVTVVLAPAKLADLGVLGVKLEVPRVSLSRQP